MATSNSDRSNLLQHGTALDNAESILPAITELGLSRAQTAELQDYIKQFLDEETKASKGCSLELLILDKFQHKWVTWRDEPLGKMQSALRTCIAFLRSGRLLVQPVIPLSTALSQEKRPRTATRPQSLPISGASRNIRTPPPWPPGRIQRPSAISGTPVQRPSVHNDDEGSSHVQNSEAIAEAIVALTPRTPGHTQTPTGALTEAELESFRKRCVKSVKGLSHEILEIHDVPRGKAALVIVENGPLSVTPFIESADDVDRPESPILGNKLRRTHQTISPGDWTTETSAADINGQHHRSPTTQGHPPLSPRHSPMDRPHTRPTFRLPPIDRSPVRPIPRLPPTRLSAPPINTPGSRTHSQTRPQQQRPMTYPPPRDIPAPAPAPTAPPSAAATTVFNHNGTDPWVRWARAPPPGRAPAPATAPAPAPPAQPHPQPQSRTQFQPHHQPQPQPQPQPRYRSHPRPCTSRSSADANGAAMPTATQPPQAATRQVAARTSLARPNNGGGGQRGNTNLSGQEREQAWEREWERQRGQQQQHEREQENSATSKEGGGGYRGCLGRWSCLPTSP